MDKPDTLTVSVALERKVYATRAALYVVEISGDSLVSGTTALKKARAVHDLVVALAGVGIEEQQIQG